MKKSNLLLGTIFLSAILIAGEKDDIAFLDAAYKQQDYDRAISESERFLLRYPQSKNLLRIEDRMAKTYYIGKNYDRAIKSFTNILNRYNLKPEERDEIYYYISKCYLFMEDEQMAAQYAEKIQKSSIFYERAYYDKGVIYLDQNDYENAFKTFQMIAVSGNEMKNAATFNMALTAYNDARYQMVIDVLNNYVKVKDKNRDDSAIAYLYGSSFYKLDKVDFATKYFEYLADKFPKTPYGKKAKITLIEIYANQGNMERVNHYSQMVKGTTEEGEALVTLGDFFVSKNQYEKAMGYYQRANLEATPRALYGYAYSLYRLDRIKEALPYFIKLEKSTYYNQAIYYKFACYYKLKDYKTIIDNRAEAKKIVVTQQDNDNVNIIIANSAYELGNFILAKDYYSRLNLHTPSKDNLFRVITMSGKLNQAVDVEKRLEEYKKLYPGDLEYRKKIYVAAGEALYNNKLIEPAQKVYREYLEKDNDPEILKSLTALLVNEKKYSEMGSVLDKQPETTENVYLRAVAATGLGNYEAAETYYTKVLDMIKYDQSNSLYVKIKLNQVKNYFLWTKYDKTIEQGNLYINLPNAQEKDDIIEKIGLSYYRMDNFDKSREYFSKLATNPEKSDTVNFQIADSYFSEKNYLKAKEIYTSIYEGSVNEKSREIALYSLSKVASATGNVAEFKKISNDFLSKYPESQYRENLLSGYSQVAEKLKNSTDIIKTYQSIYNSSSDSVVKQNALEKLTDAYLENKNYAEAEKRAVLLENEVKKAYALSVVYDKKGASSNAINQFKKLQDIPEYKEYATVNMAKSYLAMKDYNNARIQYSNVLKLSSSTYKDLAAFQIAAIDEKNGKKDQAIASYKRVYIDYPKSNYAEDSKLKVAQFMEAKDPNEGMKVYMDIAKTSKTKRYRVFALEKLIYYSLKAKKMDIAQNFYNDLNKIDPTVAKKYADFFKGGN